jgi:3-oxoacyl-[acyl-carrier-protein] synthase II
MNEADQIVITGAGVVSPIGIGLVPFWEALLRGDSGVIRHPRLLALEAFAPFVSPVKEFDPRLYVPQRKSLKVMCNEIVYGVSAASLAMSDAGLGKVDISPDRFGVVTGSENFFCDPAAIQQVYARCLQEYGSIEGRIEIGAWIKAAMRDIEPLWMLKHLPNMISCHVGIAYDARGYSNAILQGDVSSLLAINEAA